MPRKKAEPAPSLPAPSEPANTEIKAALAEAVNGLDETQKQYTGQDVMDFADLGDGSFSVIMFDFKKYTVTNVAS